MTIASGGLTCSQRLMAALDERGMSIRQLAARANLGHSYVHRCVNGHVVPSYVTLAVFASVLNLPRQPLLDVAAEDRIARFATAERHNLAAAEHMLTVTAPLEMAGVAA